jgi:F0F1-type ATP synthase assembly protein I
MKLIENHMALAEEKYNSEEAGKLEERLALIRAKIEDLSEAGSKAERIRELASEYKLNKQLIDGFYEYVMSELLATIAEEEIAGDDYFNASTYLG